MAEELNQRRGFVAKVAHVIAVIWIQIGLTLVLFCLVSMAAGAIVKRVRRSQDHVPAPIEAYQGAPWTAEYFKSLADVRMRWYPYAYWKATPMTSRYLNIDPDGDRVTWNQPRQANDRRPVLKVFMIGGSTTWGTGVRDDHTVPSLLARRLADNSGFDVQVINLGQIGYVTTQEIMLLYQLLRQGQRPDLVIFYDGVNDCFTAYQNGIAGLTQSEFFRAEEFSVLGSSWGRKKLYGTAIRTAMMSTGLADLIKLLRGQDNPNMTPHEIKPLEALRYLAMPQDFEGTGGVERGVVDLYLFNVQMARMLGERFKFRSIFYWQPTVFSKSELAPFEHQLLLGDPMRQKFFAGTYARIAAVAGANGIKDISGILNGRPKVDFIDPYHLNEAANEIIAARMAADAAPLLADLARERGSAQHHTAAASH
ncbi:MAG TPA: SGNH/GDSL hydrolase family protein [Candidatus Binataceae bacterium]|nr:SGNH/GDSL hydrolase family protein [Candidatus Binataceae bacterium]